MKKFISLMICIAAASLLFTGCEKKAADTDTPQTTTAPAETTSTAPETTTEPEILPSRKSDELKKKKTDKADVNLNTENIINNYNGLLKLLMDKDEYVDKTVKISGIFDMYSDPISDKRYCSCFIKSESGNLSQGIEFVLSDDYKYPDDYPAEGEEITVYGTFERYNESGNPYCRLKNAVFTD